jgi:hypothetical protein
LDSQGKAVGSTGKAISDSSVGLESTFNIIDQNEFEFEQEFYEDGKKVRTIKGIFIRIE